MNIRNEKSYSKLNTKIRNRKKTINIEQLKNTKMIYKKDNINQDKTHIKQNKHHCKSSRETTVKRKNKRKTDNITTEKMENKKNIQNTRREKEQGKN